MSEEQKKFIDASDANHPEGTPAEPAPSIEGELSAEDLGKVNGGNQIDRDTSPEDCPVYGSDGHNYVATGESRPTDAWFYKTEEHYKCACGKGYWSAGFFSIKKWD